MWVVAAEAIGCRERLTVVCLDQVRIFRIVAIETECRCVLGQVLAEFALGRVARFVRCVAGTATHVERGMTAPLLRDIDADVVASQAEVVIFRGAIDRLQQLLFVGRLMRVVALCAVPNRGRMNVALDLGWILI